ncbi:RNA methyltransferase [Candidatus Marinamargulisbacteria bacterium SCGC AAA071-K20]|nr:RNA methyltransferase [Candidatus Marinamargulisbacteria bacterium SCGC AAA071-K20]
MITLIATVAMGLESVLSRELKNLGYENLRVDNGKIEFDAELQDICKTNLWLRTAGRIFLKIAEFKATTFDELFEKTKKLHWSDWIGKDDYFPVTKVSSRKSILFSKSDSQAIVNKAVAESLKKSYKVDTLPETGGEFPIRIQIENDMVVLSIDTSGDGLHKRGYRSHMNAAPLRETLAAALILLSRWNPEEDALMDPMCGTGTLLIEAGLIAKNIAPGLKRKFISEYWRALSPEIWEKERSLAREQIKHDVKPRILGSDIDSGVLSIARENIAIAGLDDIFVQTLDMEDSSSRYERGKVITNPPYGERLGDREDAEKLYKKMGKSFRKNFKGWHYYVLTSNEEFETMFGKRCTRKRKLFNGSIRCDFYHYY